VIESESENEMRESEMRESEREGREREKSDIYIIFQNNNIKHYDQALRALTRTLL
tara:strand:- start:142 stop:306 length:165 start_codon:yes stop_codon:yes gene_type:complete